jgi:hypothetical protein
VEEQHDRDRCLDGSLVRKSLRVFPAIDSPGAFQKMAIRHMRDVTTVVTLLHASVSQGGKNTLTSFGINNRGDLAMLDVVAWAVRILEGVTHQAHQHPFSPLAPLVV